MTTQKMLSPFRKALTDFKMIKDGDKIAVGISGGKDSLTLLKLLSAYKRFAPEKFDLVAITVDLNFKDAPSDFTPIKEFCEKLGVPYFVEKTEIGEIIFDVRKETNPCSLCSKMRKGALNSVAVREGCNKVALGHHRDDVIETFFLSLFFEGRLSTFAPKSYLSKMNLGLIRPMIYIEEKNIKAYSKDFPVVKNRCPADTNTKREEIKKYVDKIQEDIPFARDRIFSAIKSPDRYHLFDKFFREVDDIL
ncbi:MAG: tRNA 2-thiocytidine(32) synthetase TtcA [Clostridia bacterium]|nr:tRNA 2-thiocytidine(32) synthetase TtcA [Clostridia bacterium]